MPDSPFKLLEPYGPEEKDIFFGRDAEIVALYHLLKQTRLVLIYGGSGTGKTSLIQAGLPKVFKITDWFRISVRRKDNINDSLRESITRSLDLEGAPSTGDLTTDIQKIYESRWIPIYLVFDQFEEIFTLANNEKERNTFFTSIQQILNANIPCKIILSMREEYIGHLYDYEPLVPTLFEKRFRVEPMKDATVEEVIEKMCAVKGIKLEEEKQTATQILNNVKLGKQAAYLPYLQIYLHSLYEHTTQDNQLTIFKEDDINAIGALGNVLKKFIDSKITEAQQYLNDEYESGVDSDFAQQLLDEFATGEGTKQSRKTSELAKNLKVTEDLITKALVFFSDTAKLLKADENEIKRYEPVHDVVASQIHELRTAEDKEFKAFIRKLELDYQRWVRDNRSDQRLLPELDLSKVDIYKKRLEKRDDYQKWKIFIDKSISYHLNRRKRKRILNVILIVITLLALVSSALAFYQLKQTEIAKQEAEDKSRQAKEAEEKAEEKRLEAEDKSRQAKEAVEKAKAESKRANQAKNEANKALQALQKTEHDRVMLIVDDIIDRSAKLERKHPTIAKSLIQEAIKKLSDYPKNRLLQEEIPRLEQRLEKINQ